MPSISAADQRRLDGKPGGITILDGAGHVRLVAQVPPLAG